MDPLNTDKTFAIRLTQAHLGYPANSILTEARVEKRNDRYGYAHGGNWFPPLVAVELASRAEVYQAIDGERAYQDGLAETSETDGYHTVTEFLLYIDDYVREAKQIASRTWGPTAKPKTLDVIRKIGALAVACMEQNGAVLRRVRHTETGEEFSVVGWHEGLLLDRQGNCYAHELCEAVR